MANATEWNGTKWCVVATATSISFVRIYVCRARNYNRMEKADERNTLRIKRMDMRKAMDGLDT